MRRKNPEITYLLFAGDVFLFAEATEENLTQFFNIPNTFQQWSGQKLDRSKSTFFFSRNIPNQRRNHLCRMIQMQKGKQNSRYPSLPLCIQHAKTTSFQLILDMIVQKLSTRKSRVLSQVGKTTLIRSVSASISSYTMYTVLILKTISHKIGMHLANLCGEQMAKTNPKYVEIGT